MFVYVFAVFKQFVHTSCFKLNCQQNKLLKNSDAHELLKNCPGKLKCGTEKNTIFTRTHHNNVLVET